VNSATTKSFASGVKGTPTVKINGEVFDGDLYTAGALKEAVTKAAAK
jgi:protein-disulfide isomerase